MLSNASFLGWPSWLIPSHPPAIAALIALVVVAAIVGVLVLPMHWGETVRIGRFFSWTRRPAPHGPASTKGKHSNHRQTELPS